MQQYTSNTRTNAYETTTRLMREHGIAVIIGTATERDWLDLGETTVEIVLHADGRVFVEGAEVKGEAARISYIRAAQAYSRETGIKPFKTMAVPEQPIGISEGHALHVTLGKLGIRAHSEFAEVVLNRPCPHFRDLLPSEARLIRERALFMEVA